MALTSATWYKPNARNSTRNRALLLTRRRHHAISLRALLVLALLALLALPSYAQRNLAPQHIVMPGETLGLIAQRYGVNVNQLAATNGISNAHLVYSWQQLTIPGEFAAGEAGGSHIVRPGETLDSIARLYGIDLFELQSLNNLWTWLIYAGDELALPVDTGTVEAADPAESDIEASESAETQPALDASEFTHTIRVGETLGAIAESYGVSLYDLQKLNDAWSFIIYPGQELAIPAGGEPPDEDEVDAPSKPEIPQLFAPAPAATAMPDTHTVQAGETLFSIARKYDLAVDLLMSANGISDPRRVHSGLVLRLSNLNAPAASPASSPTDTAPAAPADSARERYTVQPGESLSTIGNKLGMSWLAIAAINGINDPDTLYAGAVLQVPTAQEAARYGPVRPKPVAPGANVGVGRELIVVLSTQMAYAYENGVLRRSAQISSGLPATPTVKGDFKVTRKLRSRHMVGPDYDLPNVPWVMYFFSGYAFHGTYWHNNFGTPMSHGCVNMTNADAKWFYDFAPVGTPVHVRD